MGKYLRCRKLCSFSSQDDAKPAAFETTAIISTDYLTSKPSYKDLRTVIYIWGVLGTNHFKNKYSALSFFSSTNSMQNSSSFTSKNTSLFPNTTSDSSVSGSAWTSNTSTLFSELYHEKILRSMSNVNIIKVAVGMSHICFLSDLGNVYSYGEGQHGQLGLGENIVEANVIQKIDKLQDIVDIANGYMHSIALNNIGIVYCWGDSKFSGCLKDSCSFSPCELKAFTANKIKIQTICAKYFYNLAVSTLGKLYIWGECFWGEFIQKPLLFYTFNVYEHVKQLSIGKHFALALTKCGKVFAWGDTTYGELCCESKYSGSLSNCKLIRNSKPSMINLSYAEGETFHQVEQIACGGRHTLLKTKDGKVYSFGENIYGQCGVSNLSTRIEMLKNVKFNHPGFRAKDIICGFRHSACITQNNHLYLWGNSANHKLVYTIPVERMVSQSVQPGVSIRSGLKDTCCKARLVCSLLNEKVVCAALGDEVTVVVTGAGIDSTYLPYEN